MNVLGISAFYHDATAALVADGKLISAAAEERYTRQKHDSNYPKFAIEHCLASAGLVPQDLDTVVFYEEPHTKFTRVLASVLSGYPGTCSTFIRSMKDWMRFKLWLRNGLSRRLDIDPAKIEFCPHHLSHAYQAFVGSPFEEAAVLTVDAVGEWASTGLFHARMGEVPEMKLLETIPYPHSLGLLYSVFTAFLGFRPNDGESSVMALASFGQPIYLDQVRKVLKIQGDGTYEIDQAYLDHFGQVPYTSKFVALFGAPRSFKEQMPFTALGHRKSSISRDHQRYADVAASIQVALQESLLALANRLHRITGAPNLCLAGGVALNCVANTALQRRSAFQKLYIPPDPGDGGAAVGAAAYAASGKSRHGALSMSPYLGTSYDEEADIQMLSQINVAAWEAYRNPASSSLRGMRLETKWHRNFDQLVAEVVDDLRAGRIVGWFQGRFENGPRALGNRSLLADPKRIDVALRLSRSIKTRAEFRPYAFSVTAEDAARCMQLGDAVAAPARWMQMVMDVKEEALDCVRAATHVDGTNRAQVCTKEDNARFHHLLSQYGEASGLGALLNTSLNESGYPIAATPADALLIFARTDLDTLVINDSVVRKTQT